MANILMERKGGDIPLRPTRAIINLSALRHNIRLIRCRLSGSTRLISVVKANAYGHGAIPVSRVALGAGADWLAVAIPEEAIELRSAGFQVPILVMGMSLPEQAGLFADHQLIAAASSLESLQALNSVALAKKTRVRIMIKLDTGMSRVGVQPEAASELLQQAVSLKGIEVVGLFTHFAAADDLDPSFTLIQLERLNQTVSALQNHGIKIPLLSAANSAATAAFPGAHFDAVRPGIILYGLPPDPSMPLDLDLIPVMSLVTRIVHIKQVPANTPVNYGCTYRTPARTWLATLPVGYADGYSRQFSNNAEVLVRGIRRRVVGRVCMDQTVIDLGPELDARVGDEAVLFGRQGKAEISLTELAVLAGTINYELACAISSRVPRLYVEIN
jgi:alanine racemase